MKFWQKIVFSLFYTVFYFFIAVFSLGGGHGNFYLLLPAVPWLLIFPPIFFLGKLHVDLYKILFVLFLSAHYLLLVILVINYDFAKDRGMKHGPAIIPIAIYLAGQGVIWVSFINEKFDRQ